jgi:hypothetical protein
MFFSRQHLNKSRGLGYPTPRMSPGCASSFTSLREIPQPSAQAVMFAHKRRALTCSAQEAVGVSRSEIKEETAKRAGDIRGGSRPLTLVRGANEKATAQRSKAWAH